MQIAWPAGAGTYGELAAQLRLGAGRERAGLFVANVNPIHTPVTAHGIADMIQAVAGEPVDPIDAGAQVDRLSFPRPFYCPSCLLPVASIAIRPRQGWHRTCGHPGVVGDGEKSLRSRDPKSQPALLGPLNSSIV